MPAGWGGGLGSEGGDLRVAREGRRRAYGRKGCADGMGGWEPPNAHVALVSNSDPPPPCPPPLVSPAVHVLFGSD
eukprot:scaffold3054_cov51-Isochrysis_galbana.AAC.1